jgi:coatomer protein complex subunit alpha (xenin)
MASAGAAAAGDLSAADADAWGGDELDLGLDGGGGSKAAGAGAGGGEEGGDGGAWGDDLDLGLEDVVLPGSKPAGRKSTGALEGEGAAFVPVSEGASLGSVWMGNSSCAADHVAAGSFETAMQLLNRQIGIVNFAPLRAHFLSVYGGAHGALPTLPSLPSLDVGLTRNPVDAAPPGAASLPASVVSLTILVERLKQVYKAFHGGKFSEAQEHLDWLLSAIPMVVVSTRQDANEVKELLGICMEYKVAVYIEVTRKGLPAEDEKRQVCGGIDDGVASVECWWRCRC